MFVLVYYVMCLFVMLYVFMFAFVVHRDLRFTLLLLVFGL